MIFFLGNYSSRNRLSKCLNENLLNQTEYKPFHEILFDINVSMKQIINPLIEHQQAIEYTLINMDKKLHLMRTEGKKGKEGKKGREGKEGKEGCFTSHKDGKTFFEKVKKKILGFDWFIIIIIIITVIVFILVYVFFSQ